MEQEFTDQVLAATEDWLERFVIGLNLCPFAGHPFRGGKVRIRVSRAEDTDQLTRDLLEELSFLHEADPEVNETTLLVHPGVLTDFDAYWNYIEFAEQLLGEAGLEGIMQVASFHPDYRFEGEPPSDPSHYTNRSPYPMMHLIREDSITEALRHYPDPDSIPERNIALLREMGLDGIRALLDMMK